MQGTVNIHKTSGHCWFSLSCLAAWQQDQTGDMCSIVLLTVELHSCYHQNPTDDLVETRAFYPTYNKEKEHETYIMLYTKVHNLNNLWFSTFSLPLAPQTMNTIELLVLKHLFL